MAAVHTLHNMTLGQQSKMLNNYQVINGVIVSSGMPQSQQSSCSGGIQQSKRPIAPAPDRGSVLVNSSPAANDARCKRKINFAHHHIPYGTPGHQPASVARRNARERNRVKQVNNGFATLRQHIPSTVAAALSTSSAGSSSSGGGRGSSKKLSKVDTLRMAVEYIRSLKCMLDEHDDAASTSTSGSSMEHQSYYDGNHGMMHQTPPCSETSASPTPSYSSEGSLGTTTPYTPAVNFPTEVYDSYEPMSPEDEELLDVISWWQQQ